MGSNVLPFPRRRKSNVIQLNRHGAFSVDDIQAIRSHFSTRAETGRTTTLSWGVRPGGEFVRVDDYHGDVMISFGFRDGIFQASGPITGGQVLRANPSLQTLLEQVQM